MCEGEPYDYRRQKNTKLEHDIVQKEYKLAKNITAKNINAKNTEFKLINGCVKDDVHTGTTAYYKRN